MSVVIRKFEIPQWVHDSTTLSYDVETDSLNPRTGQIIGFGISDGTNSSYFVHKSWNGASLDTILTKEECVQVLKLVATKRLLMYNASFDCRFTSHYFGVDLTHALHSDAMLAFHAVQEDGVPFSHKPFALKTVAAHFLGEEVTSEQTDMKASIKANGGSANEFYKADTEIMAKYCMQDCLLTYRLADMFHTRIEQEGLSKFYFEDETMPLLKHVTIPMEQAGLPVDVPYLEQSLKEITVDLEILEREIQTAIAPHLTAFDEYFLNKEYPPKRTGPFAQAVAHILAPGALPETSTGAYSMAAKHVEALPDGLLKSWLQEKCYLPKDIVKQAQEMCHGNAHKFNLLSKFHLKRLFFDELKCTPLSRTDTGLPQCDEEFLESVKDTFAWAPRLIEYNKLTKIKGTYIERILTEQENGIWYPSYFQHRTVSGRFGSSAQQLSRPIKENSIVAKYNNRIRNFIIAGPGNRIIGADYESLEPKIFSHICGDPKLRNVFLNGYDFYSTVAIFTEGLTEYSANKKAPNYLGTLAPERRQKAKAYALGVPYGLTGYKMQFELNISQQESDALVQAYLDGFPALSAWMHKSEQFVLEHGYIKSETGRIRHMPRARRIAEEHGQEITDSLALWKKYHEEPGLYERMKKLRRELKNYLNNAKNYQCQSLAASVVNRACIAINKEFMRLNMRARICMQVHDEICALAPENEVAKASQIMQYIMENNYKISIPLVALPKVAEKYGDTK